MSLVIEKLEKYERALSVQEVAELFKFSEDYVTKHAKEGNLPAYRFENKWRFDPKLLILFLQGVATKGESQ